MNTLNNALKKFIGNKNTVTIIGVVLCLFILYFGYQYRINQKVKLVSLPYAVQTIQPKTLITTDLIGYMEVPEAFVKGKGSYYSDSNSIVGKYSNYNTIIAKGSLFYTELLIESKYLPDNSLMNVPEGYTVINYPVNMSTTYANSMMPDSYINIYFKAMNDEGKLMLGKFVSNIKILAVKDSAGKHVFESTSEDRTPAYMLFAVPEETHLLLRKALYLKDYSAELIIVPNTSTVTDDDAVEVSSKDIENFILDKTITVDVSELPSFDDLIEDNLENNEENNGENTTEGNETVEE